MSSKDVSFLSRVIRDISADELVFIINNHDKHKNIMLGDKGGEGTLLIPFDSDEEVIVSGLINMGLLYSKVSGYASVSYEFSPLVQKLLELVEK